MYFKKSKKKKKNKIKSYKAMKRNGLSMEEMFVLCSKCKKRNDKILVYSTTFKK